MIEIYPNRAFERLPSLVDSFDEVYEIVEKDPGTISDHLGKLLEEAGEFATAANKINGRKTRKEGDTDEAVRTNLIEEAVDSIQVILSVLAKAGIPHDEIALAFPEKNKSYEAYLKKRFDV